MIWPRANSLAFYLLTGLSAGAFQDHSGRMPYEGTESVATLMGKTDVSCILRTWRLKGILACVVGGQVRVCLWVENAYPCGILELVRQPGKTHLVEAAAAVKGLEGLRLFGTTSSHTTASETGTGLQFSEARVFTFVPPYINTDSEIPIARPRGSTFSVNYVSEFDGLGWRTGLQDLIAEPQGSFPSCSIAPAIAHCAGRWGPYTPRIGFLDHPSEVMAGYLLGLRAGRVAASPMARVVLSPYSWQPRTGHYVQMVRPSLRTCVPIGFPAVRPLESNAVSRHGAYLFIHFGLFEECKYCLPVRLLEPRPPTGI